MAIAKLYLGWMAPISRLNDNFLGTLMEPATNWYLVAYYLIVPLHCAWKHTFLHTQSRRNMTGIPRPKKNDDEEQGGADGAQWGSAFEFIITSLGFAVGLGNIWRFPNMVFSNGGGAFLIPYCICLIFIAIPLLLIEAGMGQYSAKGPIGVWDMLPLFRGCGVASLVLSMISSVYYNAPISWAAFYLSASVQSPLPWTECGYWTTPNCTEDQDLIKDLAAAAYQTEKVSYKTSTPHFHEVWVDTAEYMKGHVTSPSEEYF